MPTFNTSPTKIAGVMSVTPIMSTTYCGIERTLFEYQPWSYAQLNPLIAQVDVRSHPERHVLVGMHYQLAPNAAAKTISCLSGQAYLVVLDVRMWSHTYGRWQPFTLDSASTPIYVPEGCATGYFTQTDNTSVLTLYSRPHTEGNVFGIRWNDPLFKIAWPYADQDVRINTRDANYRDFALTAAPEQSK